MTTQKFSVKLIADFTIPTETIKMLIMDFVRDARQYGAEMNIDKIEVLEE